MDDSRLRLPPWLKVRLPTTEALRSTGKLLRANGLHTVCEGARCPNQGECWGAGTATVLILGDTCTRACRFCAVKSGRPGGVVDEGEPARVAAAVAASGLSYVVLTSVDRDDLPDGGASIYAATLRAIRAAVPGTRVEVLVPDYLGDSLDVLLGAAPDVFAHNVEVVRRLTPSVRDRRASYDRSLEVLSTATRLRPGMPTKSSVMLGLGESRDEVVETLADLKNAGVRMVTLGQYLRPSMRHLPVERYLPPEEFEELQTVATGLGFEFVAAGPLVRSSYRAAELFATSSIRKVSETA